MNDLKQTFTVSIYTENNIGLLNRISAIFLKRHINIESLTTSQSEIENIFRFVIVVNVSEIMIQRIIKQINFLDHIFFQLNFIQFNLDCLLGNFKIQ